MKKLKRTIAIAAALGVMSHGATSRAEEGPRTTVAQRVTTRPHPALLKLGITFVTLAYASSVVTAAVSTQSADQNLYIPIVGPWIDIAVRDCGAGDRCGGTDDVAKSLIVASGMAQGAGLALGLSSLFIEEVVETRRVEPAPAASSSEIRVVPLTFAAGAGFGAVGRF
jgi:hypothetical protein